MTLPAVLNRSAVTHVAFAALVAGFVAGCSSEPKKVPSCPAVSVLNGADSLTRFAPGPGRDLLDVNLQADIADVVAGCDDKEERDGEPVARVAVAPVIVASRGPANREPTQRLVYFVSIVDANQQILKKDLYDVTVDFADNRNRVVIRDDDPPIIVEVPNADGIGARGFRVLVGFQLTPEELSYNYDRGSGGVAPGTLTGRPGR